MRALARRWCCELKNAEQRSPSLAKRSTSNAQWQKAFERCSIDSWFRPMAVSTLCLSGGRGVMSGTQTATLPGLRRRDRRLRAGPCHPEIASALHDQARKLIHVSNLYYNELPGPAGRNGSWI